MLKEYEHIATAHFESQKQFALFFRYYTLFFSVPIVIFFYSDDKPFVTDKQFGGVLIGLAIIGGLFFWYAINLKNEAVLYARTVNGIRNYFYKPIRPSKQKRLRTLPLSIQKPPFYSPWNPVLLIITSVNTLSLMFGITKVEPTYTCLSALGSIIWLGLHFILNFLVSTKQADIYPSSKYDC